MMRADSFSGVQVIHVATESASRLAKQVCRWLGLGAFDHRQHKGHAFLNGQRKRVHQVIDAAVSQPQGTNPGHQLASGAVAAWRS
jgi:hypothetical protein